MSKVSKACDISAKVRKEVMERDGSRCFICGSKFGIQIAHFIPRSLLGLGIPQNLGVLCCECHFEYDNGKFHKEYKKAFKEYLKGRYEDWDENKLTYRKWG